MNNPTRNELTELLRVFSAALLALIMVLAPLASLAALRVQVLVTASEEHLPSGDAGETDSSVNRPVPTPINSPLTANISATLTDNVTAATKVAPGSTINYTATITNTGVSPTDDATNLNFSAPLDPNTTFTPGTIHASPIAFNDTYNWIGNTFLDSSARSFANVTANDVAVNGPGGTDTFTLTTIAGGATTLGGTVSLAANGSFTYTPPLGRPSIADGGTANDTFAYTIANSVDPTLTATGTVTIALTGRVWYLQAGAAGDGRSNTPSGSPPAMSTAADKSPDIFYIFSNAGSLNGLFTLENSQQLLGQGVDLVVNIPVLGSTTLFSTTAPTPTTTNTTGNGVNLASGNTLSGFNIGNCNGSAVSGTSFGTLTVGSVSINNSQPGAALTLSTGTVAGAGFTSTTSTGGTNNVSLTAVAGTVALGSGALSGAGAASFLVSGAGSTAAITYSGSISKTSAGRIADIQSHSGGNSITLSGPLTCNSGCSGINVDSNTGGTITFSGSAVTLNTQANNGVTLTNNTGATVDFSGGNLDVVTTTGKPFTATGGGTVKVGGASNTLATNTVGAGNTVLEVDTTTIGAGGLHFVSLNGNGNSSITRGVYLKSAGGNGLFVTGTGAAGTGGTLQNFTQKGVHIDSTNNINLSFMNLTGNGTTNLGTAATCGDDANGTNTNCAAGIDLQSVSTVNLTSLTVSGGAQIGINGKSVSGLTFNTVTVSGAGNEALEDGVQFAELTGTNTFTSVDFHDNASRQLAVQNSTGTGTLNISTSNFSNVNFPTGATTPSSGTAAQGILYSGHGNANMTLNIQNSTFARNFGAAVFSDTQSTAVMSFTVNGGSIQDNGLAIQVAGTGSGTMNYTLTNVNPITTNPAHAITGPISFFRGGVATGNWSGLISGNTLGTTGVAFSGSPCTSCVGMIIENSSSGPGTHNVTVSNNTIKQTGHTAIHIATSGSGSGDVGAMNAKILNNNISEPAQAGDSAIMVLAGDSVAGDTSNVCADVSGNTITNGANAWNAAAFIAMNERFTNVLRLPGFGGGTGAVAQGFVSGQNGGVATIIADGTDNFIGGGAACFLLLDLGGITPFGHSLLWGILNHDVSSTAYGFAVLSKTKAGDDPATDTFNLLNRNAPISVTQQQLDATVAAAIERWSIAGLSSAQLSAVRDIKFEIADLSAAHLGEAEGNIIRVDRDAAGNGWYIDPTPLVDDEFRDVVTATRRYADVFGAPAGHLDLLTAVMHEFGHRLGLTDAYGLSTRDDLMYGYLVKGERRLPRANEASDAKPERVLTAQSLSLATAEAETAISERTTASQTQRDSEKVAGVSRVAKQKITVAEEKINSPLSGETVSLNQINTFPAGKNITIKYAATVNTLTPLTARQASTQGTVTANGGTISVPTDDPDVGGTQATVTLLDTTLTWTGATDANWNTASNWNMPGPAVSSYAPGVSNPAVNDVVIPNVGNQPNISVSDIGTFSLNISNGRTLTITSPRVLTIGGSPGGDLTLDGIISGGNLNLGTGTHLINNAGGTGSLSSTNVATVLSGSTVTLNNDLQAGALAVNAGGSMTIANRTLSLNGSGAALVIPGGATFTTTGSTVIFNGTAAQQAAGIAYNNLTINNSIGLNMTGVTLTGNATVNGTLALTSSDLDTGAFTLTQPNTTASTGVSDVVGTVSRIGGPFALATPLTFGNPNNSLTITAGATRPTTVTFGIAKAAPANPNGYAAAVQRTYNISQTGGSGFTSTLRLHYLDSELNGNNEASLNLRRLRTSDNHWTVHLPTTLDAANNWVQSTGVLDTELSTRWTMSSLVPTAAGGVITGRIVDINGRPVEGAVVRLNGAQNRKFITDRNGNYRFEDVVTGGFYTVTPTRANFHFNPFNRSFSQTGNQTEAAFTAESMGDNANPLDTPEYFVRQQYVDVLNREPEEEGFNYWSDTILGCGEDTLCVNTQRREVAAAFFISEENQASGSYIYDVYSGALGRRPAFGEFSADRAQVVGGETLDSAKTVFAQHFVQRGEFISKYQNAATADAFVEALMQSVQSSGVDLSGERANLIDSYNQGTDLVSSRAAVLRAVADNATFKQSQYNQAFVLTEYFAYLQRDAEAEGYSFWVNVLTNGGGGDPGNYRGMVCSFVTSAEYQNRFSRIVSHSNGECSRQ